MRSILPALIALAAVGALLVLYRLPRGRDIPLLVAAPGMTTAEIVDHSTARFRVPADDDRRGRAQPEGPTRVRIHHPEYGFEVPAGRFTVVDIYEGVAWQVTATPQLDYLGVEGTIDLLRRVDNAITAAGWRPAEIPRYDVLSAELPRVAGRVRMGVWRLDAWTATLDLSAALEPGSEEAALAGMPGGGFLTTLTVYDEELERRLRGW